MRDFDWPSAIEGYFVEGMQARLRLSSTSLRFTRGASRPGFSRSASSTWQAAELAKPADSCPYGEDGPRGGLARHWWTRGFAYVARLLRAHEAEVALELATHRCHHPADKQTLVDRRFQVWWCKACGAIRTASAVTTGPGKWRRPKP